MEQNNIENLLARVSDISKKYDEIAKITGENFNIFSVMNMESNEVKTHSAIIGELLNPKGSHGLEEIPLELFVELLKNKFNIKNTEEDASIISENKFILEAKTSLAIVEMYIGNRNEDCTEGGRIDIIVQDSKGKALIIENKIYAIEQTNQLIRYNNHLKDAPILYLTLYGNPPTSAKGLEEGLHYFNISYKDDIVEWLEKCLKEAVEFPMLREVIKQYIYLIKKLTNQTTNNKMSEEIIKTILGRKENIISAIEINKIDVKQTICEELFIRIKTKLGNDFISENYNGPIFGNEESGMWFSKKEVFKIGVLLWFSGKHQLMLGIDVHNGTEEERIRIRTINGSKINWIKTILFDDYFNNLGWEDVLDDKNIAGIVNEIKQLIEEVDSIITE